MCRNIKTLFNFEPPATDDEIHASALQFVRPVRDGAPVVSGDLPPLPETPAGRYRHYKGGEYEVIGVARHSETLEPLVIYRPLYNDSGLWARPHAIFFEEIDIGGKRQRRFQPA